MRKIVFDIETSNFFDETGSNDPASLTLACVCIHDSETDTYSSYREHELNRLWPILEKTDLLIGFNSDHFDIPLLNKYYKGDLTKIKSIDLLKEVRKRTRTIIEGMTATNTRPIDWIYVKDEVREKIGQFLFSKTARRPMVLPVVIEV